MQENSSAVLLIFFVIDQSPLKFFNKFLVGINYVMDDMKGATTMTWEELEDCGVSIYKLSVQQIRTFNIEPLIIAHACCTEAVNE